MRESIVFCFDTIHEKLVIFEMKVSAASGQTQVYRFFWGRFGEPVAIPYCQFFHSDSIARAEILGHDGGRLEGRRQSLYLSGTGDGNRLAFEISVQVITIVYIYLHH
jgi:hypothetical protein